MKLFAPRIVAQIGTVVIEMVTILLLQDLQVENWKIVRQDIVILHAPGMVNGTVVIVPFLQSLPITTEIVSLQ